MSNKYTYKKYEGKLIEVFNDPGWGDAFKKWLYLDPCNYFAILSHIADNIEGKIILDLGTYKAHSAFMLGENKKNKVISYDIKTFYSEDIGRHLKKEYPNIEFKTQNCLEIPLEEIRNASLIFLDIDPHNGIQENKMMQRIRKSGFSGLLICDDILMSTMQSWWNSILEDKYMEPTGNAFGTGFVFFSEESKEMII